MMPLSLFIFMLTIVFIIGMIIILKSLAYPSAELSKTDVYLRFMLFLIALFFTIATSTGVYVTLPADVTPSVPELLAFDSFWIMIPLSITVVSFFATLYAWLVVFLNVDKLVKRDD